MIRPHKIERHFFVVHGTNESVIQALFEKRTVVLPVTIVNKYIIYTMTQSFFDLKLHNFRISFILITPKRYSGKNLSVNTLPGALNRLSLADNFFPR